MIDLTYEEIVEICEKIQYEIYEQTDYCEYFTIECSFCSEICIIEFIGLHLWNSEDDMRNYIDDDDEYEPLEDYLRRMINEEIKKLRKVKL